MRNMGVKLKETAQRMDKRNRGEKLVVRERSTSSLQLHSAGQTVPEDTWTRWGIGACTFPTPATLNLNSNPSTRAAAGYGVSAPCACARAREGAAHDLNVLCVPHALHGDICVRVDTTCLGPDKRHLIDIEKGADKRPSGAGEPAQYWTPVPRSRVGDPGRQGGAEWLLRTPPPSTLKK